MLAIATFASIRSANRSARIAEAAFRANLRPVLVTSRLDDPDPEDPLDGQPLGAAGGRPGHRRARRRQHLYGDFAPQRRAGARGARSGGPSARVDEARHGPAPDNPTSSGGRRGTSTSPRTTSGSGRRRSGSPTDPDYAWLCARTSRQRSRSPSNCSTATHEGGQRTITRFGMIPYQIDGRREWYPQRRPALEPGPARSPLAAGTRRRGDRGRRSMRRHRLAGLRPANIDSHTRSNPAALVLDEADAQQLEGHPAVDAGPDELAPSRRLGPSAITPAAMARCTAATRVSNAAPATSSAWSLGSNPGTVRRNISWYTIGWSSARAR